MFRFIALVLTLFFFCQPASRLWAMDVPVRIDFARDEGHVLACMTYEIPAGYHAYANKPGGSGKPTKLEFVLSEIGSAPVLYPAGKKEPDIFDRSTIINSYSGTIHLLAMLPPHVTSGLYAANLSMLLCSDKNCTPISQSYAGNIPENIPLLADVTWRDAARQLISQQGDEEGTLSMESGIAPPLKPRIASPDMAPAEKGSLVRDLPAEVEEDIPPDLYPRYLDENNEIYSIGPALLLGLIAGLILNMMPCVLPVLTMKIGSLLSMGAINDSARVRIFRLHNLSFAAGILTFFTLLAFLLGGLDMMWGQLYQSQPLLLGMLFLVFLMGLSMLGVFSLPTFDLRLGQETRNPLLKSYLTGMISTFLATPCSGPLLGGVLAWAFTQTLPVLMLVFWSVGLGMSLPYVAFSALPALVRFMPRPGRWMNVIERILGFLLLGTSIYILTILPADKRTAILAILLMTAFGAWLWGRFCGYSAPVLRRRVGGVTGILLICGAILWIMQPPAPAPEWVDFTPGIFEKNLGKRDMLVQFTADWCPNCKFVEASVLNRKNLARWQKEYNFELIKVDLTEGSPYAEKLLAQLGSKSIPLTALFPRGQDASQPLVLRDIYGRESLVQALKTAF